MLASKFPPSRQMSAISHQLDVTVTFLSNCSRRGGRGRPMTSKCRKSIFVSLRRERLRMTSQWPSHIYREDVLRRASCLHAILVVVLGHGLYYVASGDGFLAQSEMGGISGFLLRNHYPDFTIEVRARHTQLIFTDSRQKMPPKVAKKHEMCLFDRLTAYPPRTIISDVRSRERPYLSLFWRTLCGFMKKFDTR